jgi:hypothetical protein
MGCRVPKHRRHMAPFDRRGCCSHCDCSNCPCDQEKKEIRIDEYTGTYTADYENFSDTAYLFGGTSIKREAGKELSIDCTLEVTEGTAKVFWISGSDEAVTLIEASILDNVTRESVESTLVKNGNRLVRNSIDVSV